MTPRARKLGSWIALAVVVPLAVVAWVVLLRNQDETPPPPPGHVVRVYPSTTPAAAMPRPRPTTRRGPTPEQLAEAHTADDAQQQELAGLLAQSEPVTALPAWAKKVAITPDGRWVFYAPAAGKLFGTDALKDSAERFVAGKTMILREGRLELIDSRGRFWISRFPYGPLYSLKDSVWSEPSLKPAQPPPDMSTSAQRIRANFAGQSKICAAKECRDGVCRFLIETVRDSYLLLSVAPDGQSTCDRIADADHDTDLNAYATGFRGRFVEQDNGLITIWPHGSPIAKVFQFDGTSWVTLALPKLPNAIYGMMAMQDGSLLLIDSSHQLYTYWSPAAAKGAVARVDGYISDLSDASFDKRRAAYVHLSLCGEMARPRLLAAQKEPNNLPETTQAVERLLADLGKPRQRSDEGDVHQTLYAGRYWYSRAHLAAEDWHGRPLLMFSDFVDAMRDQSAATDLDLTQPHTSEDVVLAVLQDNGDLEIKAGYSREQMTQAGWQDLPRHFFVDNKLQLWAEGRKAFNADLSIAKSLRGQYFTFFNGQDRDGRILAEQNDVNYIVRPDAAPVAPQLPEQEFTGNDWIRLTPDGHSALAHAGLKVGRENAGALDIYRLDGTKAKWLTCPFDGSALEMVTPLKDGKVFAYFAAVTNPISAGYYDGKAWKSDSNPATLLGTLYKEMAASAGPRFTREGEFAADGAGHLWSYLVTGEPQPDARQHGVDYYNCERLLYFDGQIRHDVWAEWNRLDGKPVAKPANDPLHSAPGEGYPEGREPQLSTRGGTAMLVQNKRFETWQLHYEGTKLVVQPIVLEGEVLRKPGPGPVDPNVPQTSELQGIHPNSPETSTGETWFSLQRSKKIVELKDAHLNVTPHRGRVLMADSHDHIWAVELKSNDDPTAKLFVLAGGRRIDVTLPGATRIDGVVEGPDHRLWVGDPRGLYELSVDGDAATLTVKVVNHWSWPSLRTSFVPIFVDNSNGLWCGSSGAVVTRVALPQAKAP